MAVSAPFARGPICLAEGLRCGLCGRDLILIREDITEQLDVEPAKFSVIRHIRPQYARKPCGTITAAAIPAAVIDGGIASVGLLTWIMVCKFVDHLPLYRKLLSIINLYSF